MGQSRFISYQRRKMRHAALEYDAGGVAIPHVAKRTIADTTTSAVKHFVTLTQRALSKRHF